MWTRPNTGAGFQGRLDNVQTQAHLFTGLLPSMVVALTETAILTATATATHLPSACWHLLLFSRQNEANAECTKLAQA